MMLSVLKILKEWLIALGGYLGILYIPSDLFGLSEAYPRLKMVTNMIDRFTILAIFSGFLVLYILWIDLRPLIKGKLLINRFEKFLADYEGEKPSFHSATKDSYLIQSESYEKKFAARFDREILPLISKRRISVEEYKITQRRWREVYNTVINSQS